MVAVAIVVVKVDATVLLRLEWMSEQLINRNTYLQESSTKVTSRLEMHCCWAEIISDGRVATPPTVMKQLFTLQDTLFSRKSTARTRPRARRVKTAFIMAINACSYSLSVWVFLESYIAIISWVPSTLCGCTSIDTCNTKIHTLGKQLAADNVLYAREAIHLHG